MKTESVISLDQLEQLEALCVRHENATTDADRNLEFLLTGVTGMTREYFLRELLWQDIEKRQRNGGSVATSDYSFSILSDNQIVEEVIREMKRDADRVKADEIEWPERYEKIESIGRGGVGEVWRVEDLHSQRPLAVKLLRKKFRHDRQARIRLEREAILTGRLQHPGIPPVHDHGLLADNSPYFAMKLIEGKTLAELLAERSGDRLDIQKFIAIFEQVAQTMAYVHSQNVIHRDLKPQNIMVGVFGEVQVMDWGMAKRLNAAQEEQDLRSLAAHETPIDAVSNHDTVENSMDSSLATGGLTRFGDVVGTPAYMAPEQARGETTTLSAASDVFALGAILYEILTGSRLYPKQGMTDGIELAATADTSKALESLLKSNADPNLISLCRDCLKKDQANRLQNGNAVATRMTDYLDSLQMRIQQNEIDLASAKVKAIEAKRRQRIKTILFTALVFTFLAGFAATAWQWNKTSIALADSDFERKRAEREKKKADLERNKADEQSELAFKTLNGVVFDYQEAFEILRTEDFSNLKLANANRVREKMLQKLMDGMQQISVQLKEKPDFNINAMVIHLDLADFYLDLGVDEFKDGRALALAEYQQSIEIGKTLVELAPDDQYCKRLYAQSLEGMAKVNFYQENFIDAQKFMETAIEVEEKAWAQNKNSTSIPHDLIQMNFLAGTIHLKSYSLETSAEYFLESINVFENATDSGIEFPDMDYLKEFLIPETKRRLKIVTTLPEIRENPMAAFDHDKEIIPKLLYDCARWHLFDGEREDCVELLKMVEELENLAANYFYDVACGYSCCCESILGGRQFDELEPDELDLAEQYLDGCLSALKNAQAGNFFEDPMTIALVGRDSDLDAVRETEEFKMFFDQLRKLD